MIFLVKLLSDFGLVILIWLVQIIIYPSFSYYAAADLLLWHERYTRLISYIVLPLMLVQLLTTGILAFQKLEWPYFIQLFAIVLIWCSTFFQAVPLHRQISDGHGTLGKNRKLVRVNWVRTILWSLIFPYSFFLSAKELL